MIAPYRSEKVRHAIAYIASKLTDEQNMYKVLKVMYFAEKCHLRKFGRTIFGGQYVAMRHGPVPWSAYRKVTNERDGWNGAQPDPLYRVEKTNTIITLQEPDLDQFSGSDLACIDEEIELCRHLSFKELRTRSHDAAYVGTKEDDAMTLESIAAASVDSPEERDRLLAHLASV